MIVTVTLNTAIDRVVEVRGLRPGEVNRGELRRLVPAGKGVNVACVLGALGFPSVASGFVGADEVPFFNHNLENLGCASPPSPKFTPVAGRTRVNTTIVDPERNRETHIRELGFRTSPAEKKALRDNLARIVKPGDYVVISGSLPREYSIDDLNELIAMLRAEGARVLVDCPGAGASLRSNKGLWALMVNRAELSEALGKEIAGFDAFVAAAAEIASSVELVIASDGPRGAVVVAGGEALHGSLEVPPGDVVNTVGAGDSLVAGFVAGWVETGGLEAALRLAQAAAGSKVMHLGSSEIDPEFVEQAKARVRIKRLRVPFEGKPEA